MKHRKLKDEELVNNWNIDIDQTLTHEDYGEDDSDPDFCSQNSYENLSDLSTLVNRKNRSVPAPIYLPATIKKYAEEAYSRPELNHLSTNASWYFPYILQSFAEKSNKPTMLSSKSSGTFVLGDSGGYSVITGAWKKNWMNSNQVQPLLNDIVNWYKQNCDVGLILDIPPRAIQEQTSLNSFQDCLDATEQNLVSMLQLAQDYPLLNVLQTCETQKQTDQWYDTLTQHKTAGYAFGAVKSFYDFMYLFVKLIEEEKLTDRIHILGHGQISWLYLLNVIQEYYPDLHITMDSSTSSRGPGAFGTTFLMPEPLRVKCNKSTYFPNTKAYRKTFGNYHWMSDKNACRSGLLRDLCSPVTANKTVLDLSNEQLAKSHTTYCAILNIHASVRILNLKSDKRRDKRSPKLRRTERAVRRVLQSSRKFQKLEDLKTLMKGKI